MITPCISLKDQFGRRYRIAYEASYLAEYGPGARTEDPWLMIIPCKYGVVLPWNVDALAASVDGHPNVAAKLRRLKCCHVVQDGDFGELTATFAVADLPKVAKIMRPRRRRKLSPDQLERLRAMGFKKGAQAHGNVRHTARTGDPVGQNDS